MMEMGKQGCGAGSSCLGETLETPENFVGHGILVLQVDLLAQCAEIAIRREQRRRAVVLCQRKVERVIDVMAKQPCQLGAVTGRGGEDGIRPPSPRRSRVRRGGAPDDPRRGKWRGCSGR